MDSRIRQAILDAVPADGSSLGNKRLVELVTATFAAGGKTIAEADVHRLRDALVAERVLNRGRGRKYISLRTSH